MDEMILMKDMTDPQRMMFQSEMNKLRKDRTTGLLLTLFLGGIGAHHFYLGKVGLGVLYLVFCWTLLPAIVGFIELFLIMGRIDKYNEDKAQEAKIKVKALS